MLNKALFTLLALQLIELSVSQLGLSSNVISSSVKDDILETESFAEAYNKYMEAYTDPEDLLLMASTDPISLKKKRYDHFL